MNISKDQWEKTYFYIDNVLLVIIAFLFIALSYEIKSQNFIIKYIKETILWDWITYLMWSYMNC